MILTNKQEQGLKIAVARYKAHEPYTCIAGYAGTGKSTLIKFIISALNIPPEDVCYAAYTGKAAKVLKEKGCPNAMTTHRLLYDSYPRKDGTFYHKIKRPLDYPYKIIVVDEISMLPLEMWNLLLSHNIHVLCLGDPFQLPPIGEDNQVLYNPHIFLDEVVRQAQESEIIRLTMSIRENNPLTLFTGKEVQIIQPKDIVGGMYGWADQIIVGKNQTRRVINSQMREMLWGVTDDKPIEGDRVICLHNVWEKPNCAGDVMVNGSIGTIHNIRYNYYHPFLKPHMMANFRAEENDSELTDFENIDFDYKLLTTGEPTVNNSNFSRFPKWAKPIEFDYAYCITCHKSQGSEYNKVLVFEEYLKGNEHSRWLYTAATRAKEKLIIIKRN